MNNLDEVKALMRFHLLLSEYDLSERNYAAVDADGELYAYTHKPYLDKTNNEWEWTGRGYILIHMMEVCDDWQNTLIEL